MSTFCCDIIKNGCRTELNRNKIRMKDEFHVTTRYIDSVRTRMTHAIA